MNEYNNVTSTATGVDATGVQLLGENKKRTLLVLFNQGTEKVHVSFGVPAAFITLRPGAGMNFKGVVPMNAITAKTTTGTSTLTVMEA